MLKFFKGKKDHKNQRDGNENVSTDNNDNSQGWSARLKIGLTKSSSKFNEGLKNALIRKKLDAQSIEDLEELLIASDMGVKLAASIASELAKEKFNKDVTFEEVKLAIAAKIMLILQPVTKSLEINISNSPHILLVCGVNGSGKTTTIGKLSKEWQDSGKKVMLAACDTFRAAAVEQLQAWANKSGCAFVRGELNADPASVAYNALEQAKSQGVDILILDTAGRLQNKKNLMEQLTKVVRVIKKIDENAPHNTVIVLDATTGQNAINQVEIFSEAVDVTGIIVAKLDGTAKGGILVNLAQQFKLPIHAIGVGEAVSDLRPFDAKEFINNLLGIADIA